MVVASRRGNGELVFNEYRVSVLQDENSSVDGRCDGCTATGMYLTSLNCTLRNG